MTSDDRTVQSTELLNPRVNDLNRIMREYARVNQEITEALNMGNLLIDEFRAVHVTGDVQSSDIGKLFMSFQQYIAEKFEELESIAVKVNDV